MNEGPTPEALARGVYALKRISKKGPKVYVNQEPTPIHRAYNRDKLNQRQFEAAKAFEIRYIAYWSRSSGRNILDTTVRGRGSTDESQQERSLRAKERLNELETCLGMTKKHLSLLVDICVDYEPIGDCRPNRRRYVNLLEGLDCIANQLKLR